MGQAPLTFVDGVPFDVDDLRLYLGAAFKGMEIGVSRMLLYSGESRWMSHDIKTKIISVDAPVRA